MKKINIICGILAAITLILGGKYYYDNHIMVDANPPEFACASDTIECTIDAGKEELCQGLTASDDRDGDLTDQIMVNEIFIKEGNEFSISYVVFDSANNMSTFERTLVYSDYTAPRFNISTPLKFASMADVNFNLQKYLTATDCIEGDISSQITLNLSEKMTDSTASGSYSCEATVENRFGDTATIPLTIDIEGEDADSVTGRPVITLTDYIIYVEKGTTVNPDNYLKTLSFNKAEFKLLDGKIEDYLEYSREYRGGYYSDENGIFTMKSVVDSYTELDTEVPGTYTITYTFKDEELNLTGKAILIVVVEDN